MRAILAQAESETKGILDNDLLDEWRIPFGNWMDQAVDWIAINMRTFLDVVEWPFRESIEIFISRYPWSLENISWIWVVLAMGLLAAFVRNAKVGVFVALALTICGLLGNAYWIETARTIGFIGVAVLLCVVIGIPIGVAAGRIDGFWQVVRPVLDAMQVVHSFVYMLPFIFFWGIGEVSATMVTMIFALPPLIRLTNLGVRQVPSDVVEAARAYGAPEWRVLFDVQLPLARPAIMTGINQTLLLAISMLGIAAIMGAGGLGRLLFQALNTQQVSLATSAGLAFFLVAVVLDRMSQRESADAGRSLATRIRRAWQHRRDPEVLIPSEVDTQAATTFESSERYAPIAASERLPIAVTAVGGLLAIVSVVMPWTTDAGKFSAFGRTEHIELAGQSFSGLDAAGGSWFGVIVLGAAMVVVLAAVVGYLRPGEGPRWFAADGALIGAIVVACVAGAHLLGRAYSGAAAALEPGTGLGVIVAIVGGVVAIVGAYLWLRVAEHSPLHPLAPGVATGRLVGIAVAIVILGVGVISAWSFDGRAEAVITPELQQRIEELRQQAAENPADAGPIAAQIAAEMAAARTEGAIVVDGRSSNGSQLGLWTLLVGVAGAAAGLLASGIGGAGERKMWLWNTLLAGLGAGAAAVPMAWIATHVRSADPNYVSGIGSFLAMCAGLFLLAAAMTVLKEFRRSKVYDDEPAGAILAEVEELAAASI